ncbi:MAG: glycerate kinase [Spirochaetota bacterium]
MTYTIAFNSFKESASAIELTRAAAQAIRKEDRKAVIHAVPIADGGDGTVEALVAACKGRIVQARTVDPLFRKMTASYGMLPGGTAVIEMAKASGLALLRREERDPLRTTTLGTGMLIMDAVKRGAKTIIVGIGGSATTDAGLGVASALGYRLLDNAGNDVSPTGAGLSTLARILPPRERITVKVIIASDVKNMLYGKNGAAYIYAPQKGASPDTVKALDKGLINAAKVIKRDLGIDVHSLKGGGAAGGLGAGLAAFAGGVMQSGIDMVLSQSGIEEKIQASDIVFTGEGAVDAQTVFGKAPHGVAVFCKKHGVPCIIIAGAVRDGAESLYKHGVTALFSIAPGPVTLEDSMKHTLNYTSRTVEAIVRMIRDVR